MRGWSGGCMVCCEHIGEAQSEWIYKVKTTETSPGYEWTETMIEDLAAVGLSSSTAANGMRTFELPTSIAYLKGSDYRPRYVPFPSCDDVKMSRPQSSPMPRAPKNLCLITAPFLLHSTVVLSSALPQQPLHFRHLILHTLHLVRPAPRPDIRLHPHHPSCVQHAVTLPDQGHDFIPGPLCDVPHLAISKARLFIRDSEERRTSGRQAGRQAGRHVEGRLLYREWCRRSACCT